MRGPGTRGRKPRALFSQGHGAAPEPMGTSISVPRKRLPSSSFRLLCQTVDEPGPVPVLSVGTNAGPGERAPLPRREDTCGVSTRSLRERVCCRGLQHLLRQSHGSEMVLEEARFPKKTPQGTRRQQRPEVKLRPGNKEGTASWPAFSRTSLPACPRGDPGGRRFAGTPQPQEAVPRPSRPLPHKWPA